MGVSRHRPPPSIKSSSYLHRNQSSSIPQHQFLLRSNEELELRCPLPNSIVDVHISICSIFSHRLYISIRPAMASTSNAVAPTAPEFWCKICKLPFKTDGAFKLHKVNSERHICCDVCGADFKSEEGKKRHRAAVSAFFMTLTSINNLAMELTIPLFGVSWLSSMIRSPSIILVPSHGYT